MTSLPDATDADQDGEQTDGLLLAIDIGNSSTWRSRLRAHNYIDNVSGEPWHFARSEERRVGNEC